MFNEFVFPFQTRNNHHPHETEDFALISSVHIPQPIVVNYPFSTSNNSNLFGHTPKDTYEIGHLLENQTTSSTSISQNATSNGST